MLPALPGGRTLGRRTRLHVAPGAAASFDLQGEGRAAAQARAVLLGEALPPLRLAFRDSVGNAAGRPPAPGAVTFEVLSGPVHAGGAVVADVRAEATIAIDEESGNLLVEGLRIVGHPAASPGDGLSVFRLSKAATQGGTQTGAQRESAGAAPVPTAEVHLAVHVSDMVSQGFPLRIRPGAPHSIQLLPGHPFSNPDAAASDGPGESDVVESTPLDGQPPQPSQPKAAGGRLFAAAISGDVLPEFQVKVLDVWGNATASTVELPFQVAVASSGLNPSQGLFDVDQRCVVVRLRMGEGFWLG